MKQAAWRDLGVLEGAVLLFGGPYSNLQAARALIDEAARRAIPAANAICTGDVVAYCGDPAETTALIRDWGGQVSDELTGAVDFLVLGSRPVLPPEPAGTAPLEIQREFIRLRQKVERYDDMFDKAVKTSIPILNLNRLETLIAGR